MNKESLRNHAWVIKTAIQDMIPFSGFVAKNRNGDPLYDYDYSAPVQFDNVGYYGNTIRGVATSETHKRLGIMADALAIGTLLLGKLSESNAVTHDMGLLTLVFGGMIWIWSKHQFMGSIRKDFHTDFEHNLYPYEKPKRKGKRKWVDGELVEIIDE